MGRWENENIDYDGVEALAARQLSLSQVEIMGLGIASEVYDTETSDAWFLCLKWNELQNLRYTACGQPPCDAHMTLGFTKWDVHNAHKGMNSII